MAGISGRKSLTWVIETPRKPISSCVLLLDGSGPLGPCTRSGCALVAALQMPNRNNDQTSVLVSPSPYQSCWSIILPRKIAILIVRDFRQTDGHASDWRALGPFVRNIFV